MATTPIDRAQQLAAQYDLTRMDNTLVRIDSIEQFQFYVQHTAHTVQDHYRRLVFYADCLKSLTVGIFMRTV